MDCANYVRDEQPCFVSLNPQLCFFRFFEKFRYSCRKRRNGRILSPVTSYTYSRTSHVRHECVLRATVFCLLVPAGDPAQEQRQQHNIS